MMENPNTWEGDFSSAQTDPGKGVGQQQAPERQKVETALLVLVGCEPAMMIQ